LPGLQHSPRARLVMAFGEGIRSEPTEALPRDIDGKLDFED